MSNLAGEASNTPVKEESQHPEHMAFRYVKRINTDGPYGIIVKPCRHKGIEHINTQYFDVRWGCIDDRPIMSCEASHDIVDVPKDEEPKPWIIKGKAIAGNA